MLVYLYFPSLDILCLQLPNMCSVSPVFLKKTGCELAVLFIYAPWVPWDKTCYNQKRHKSTKSRLYFLRIFFHLFYWYLFYIFLPEKSSYQKSQICIRNLRLRVYNLVNSGIWVFCFWGGINLHAQFLWVFPVCCFSLLPLALHHLFFTLPLS